MPTGASSRCFPTSCSASSAPCSKSHRGREDGDGGRDAIPKSTRRLGKAPIETFKRSVREQTGKDFPQDVREQLRLAIVAVFDSWNSQRAIDYRRFNKIPDDYGTAVSVVSMVFGNLGDDSGTGVAFTRDPNTGERKLFGEYLRNAQGEDVVAGIRTPEPISDLKAIAPGVYAQFVEIADKLERHYRDMQDLEFTVERGKLYMLQTRSAKRSAEAAVRVALDMVHEGIIDRNEALRRSMPPRSISSFTPASIRAERRGRRKRPQRLAGRGLRLRRFRTGNRGRVGRRRETDDSGSRRNDARRRARHDCRSRRADRARRRDVARRRRGPGHGQAVRHRVRGARDGRT